MEQVEALRGSWKEIQWHPNADIDFYSTLIAARKSVFSPYVIALKHNGVLKTIFVGRIENTCLDCKFGYKTIFRPRLKAINISYGGILGDASRENCSIVVSEIMKRLSDGEAEAVCLSHLNVNSDIYAVARTVPNALCRDPSVKPSLHWGLSVPASMEEYFNSIDYKFRKNLRRSQRNLIKFYPSGTVVRCFQKVEEVNTFMRDAEIIAAKSYQRSMNVGFKYDSETLELVTLAARLGWFRGYILYIDDTPVAFERTTQYGHILFCENAAYDSSYRNVEPGTNLFLKLLEDICGEGKINYIDFGFGDAFYKKNFCNQVLQEESVYIFAPTFKSVSINIMRIVINSISLSAENIAGKLKIIPKIKKSWRSNLNKNHTDENTPDQNKRLSSIK